jgi:hypothetical protein
MILNFMPEGKPAENVFIWRSSSVIISLALEPGVCKIPKPEACKPFSLLDEV